MDDLGEPYRLPRLRRRFQFAREAEVVAPPLGREQRVIDRFLHERVSEDRPTAVIGFHQHLRVERHSHRRLDVALRDPEHPGEHDRVAG